MIAIYSVFRNITQLITLLSFIFITSLVTSQRELVFINQMKDKRTVNRTNAKIIYYHIRKSLGLSLFIMVFRYLIRVDDRGPIPNVDNVMVEEISQHTFCQAENILTYVVILGLIDFSYYKKDSSINMGINKQKQTHVYQLIKKYQNQILNHTFSNQNINDILQDCDSEDIQSLDQSIKS